MKVFQIRQDDRFAWYETSKEHMEDMVNKCGWQGRVLELAKDDSAQPVQQPADLIDIIRGALVDDVVKYHSPEWVARARAAVDGAPGQQQPAPAASEMDAFIEWFANNGGPYGSYKDAQDVFFAGYRAAPVAAPVAIPATVTLDGHQLRMALDFINPDGLEDRDQLDNDLTFGVRKHWDDTEEVAVGMCCWNDDTDGVLPLDGEYEGTATVQPDSGRDAALVDIARMIHGAGVMAPDESHYAVARAALAAHPANVAQDVREATNHATCEGYIAERDSYRRERDYNSAAADQLAGCIAKYFDVKIGEHGNDPWDVAVSVIENATANVAQVGDTELLDTLIRYCGSERFCLIDQNWHFLDPRGRIAGIGATQREAILAAAKKGPTT